MSATDALAELERRVTEKYVAATQARQVTAIDFSPWNLGVVAVSDLPQFPREQWVTYPTRRVAALLVVDVALDSELSVNDWQTISWLMFFGGRERIA